MELRGVPLSEILCAVGGVTGAETVKTDRLLAIVMTLLNRRETTAPELAAHFEVSVRTIYRDIDALSAAGIPVEPIQGRNGGFRLRDGFRMDRTVMTSDELETIQVALNGVAGVLKTQTAKNSAEKLKVVSGSRPKETLVVDLEPWGELSEVPEAVELLREAAREHRWVTFRYQAVGAEARERRVEPYLVVFKNLNWYLYGFCGERQAFRLFRLGRLQDLKVTDRRFEPRPVHAEERPWDTDWNHPINRVRMVFKVPATKLLHLKEWLPADSAISEDGSYILYDVSLPHDEGLYRFLLSFSGDVEVVSPPEVRGELARRAAKIFEMHQK